VDTSCTRAWSCSPDDAPKYLDENGVPYTPDSFPLATAVRISADYPGFFPPTGEVPTLDFSISQADKDFLHQLGYDTEQQFFAAAPRAVNRFGRASPAVGRRADG
jgi:hypothetical protein